MNLTNLIRGTYGFQNRLMEEDIQAVAFACQMMMEDSGLMDEDGCLCASHCQQIAQRFPGSASRSTYIYTTAQDVLSKIQDAFEDLANGNTRRRNSHFADGIPLAI